MRRTHLNTVALAIVIGLSLLTQARSASPSVLSPSDASLLGLEQAWGINLQVGAGPDLIDVTLHVDHKRSVKYIDIMEGETLLWRRSVDSLDTQTGLAMGEELVRKQAERELLFLKARGKTGTIKETEVPRIWIYALGSRGTVQAIDAETGETKWVARAGNPEYPKYDLAVNDDYVAFISGADLIQLEAETGDIVEIEPTTTIPVGSPIMSGEYIVIPTARGGIEAHHTADIREPPFLSITSGNVTARPAVFSKSSTFAWPTSRNLVYCMETLGKPAELFRIHCDGAVTGMVGTIGKYKMYFSTDAGYVYGIEATRLGKLLWKASTSEAMYGDTVCFGDQVYATAGSRRLYAFKADTGVAAWPSPTPNISKVIGVIGDALLVQDTSDRLTVLSAVSGARAAAAIQSRVHRAVVNHGTDRVYLVSETGYLQCLRIPGRELPEVKFAIERVAKPKAKDAQPQQQPANQPKADPFGAGAVDPFGNANPFDGGGAAPGADPFGAGDAGGKDPFGGGGADPFGS